MILIIQQFFETESSTFTYLVGDEQSGEAIIIDPVDTELDKLMSALNSLDLKLTAAIDTHVHADHITALGKLRDLSGCQTYLGKPGDIACADNPLADGDIIKFGQYELNAIYTPGHTDDSYCFLLKDGDEQYLFTGDTLLIGGTGRTDFQNGSAANLYDSLHQKLLTLPDETIVYPGHDYKGQKQSTIGNEKATNQRIQIASKEEFIQFMKELKLPNPKLMDVAVPANQSCGQTKF